MDSPAEIQRLDGLEILDSRGRPTLQVRCALAGGAEAAAQAPSGASTGRAEAVELRDGDPSRHAGLGCRQAAANVGGEIAAALCGRRFASQQELDEALVRLDGTANKSRLGANALLGVSIAFARAVAARDRTPLYRHFAQLLDGSPTAMPQLTVNLFSGGKHAGGQVAIQDVLVVPLSADSISQSLEMTCAVYRAAAELCRRQYDMRLLTADEGGLAPPFPGVQQMLDDAVRSIEAAGLRPGRDMAIALDVAASHFYQDDHYLLGGQRLSRAEMIDLIAEWVRRWPIVSVEDGLAEDDWAGWPLLRSRLEPDCQTVGDDLLCTQVSRIERAVRERPCDTLLLKVNQVGTLTEAAEALRTARAAGWRVIASARSGETEDHWLADLAVGWSADQIKVGSVTQSDRLAKYNRLLAIEAEAGLPMREWR